MASLVYTIDGGVPPFKVELFVGGAAVRTEYKAALGQYVLGNVPEAEFLYILITDAVNCEFVIPIYFPKFEATWYNHICESYPCIIDFEILDPPLIDLTTTTTSTIEPPTTTTTTTVDPYLVVQFLYEFIDHTCIYVAE